MVYQPYQARILLKGAICNNYSRTIDINHGCPEQTRIHSNPKRCSHQVYQFCSNFTDLTEIKTAHFRVMYCFKLRISNREKKKEEEDGLYCTRLGCK